MKKRTYCLVVSWAFIEFLILTAGISSISPASAQERVAQTVTIDGSREYQTIEGWGFTLPGAASMKVGINPLASFPFRPGKDAVFYRLLFDSKVGLGMTHMTFYQHWDMEGFWSGTQARTYEETNDNSDPTTINWAGFALSPEWPNWKVLRKTAAYGAQLKLQVGAAPIWMKSGENFSRWNPIKKLLRKNRRIPPKRRGEFAEYLVAFLLYAKDKMGVEIPYLTIQNEPNASGASTLYGPRELAATLNAVARMLDAKGLSSKLVAPESVNVSGGISYGQEFIDDPIVRNRLAAISVHPYGGDTAPNWRNLFAFAASNKLPVWQGEWSTAETTGGAFTIQDALKLAQDMRRHLIDGNVSVWFGFSGVGSTAGTHRSEKGALIIFTPHGGSDFTYLLPPRYYAFGQFSKFVRPGSIRIEATSQDSSVKVIAFKNLTKKTFTLVAINSDSSQKTIICNIDNLPALTRLEVIRTSGFENGMKVGHVKVTGDSFTYSLPAQSITTLTGPLRLGY